MPSGRRGRVLTARIEGHCTPWVATRRSCFAEATRPHVTLIMTTHTFLIIFLATRTSIHDSLLIRLVFIRHYSSVPSRRSFILHFFFPFFCPATLRLSLDPLDQSYGQASKHVSKMGATRQNSGSWIKTGFNSTGRRLLLLFGYLGLFVNLAKDERPCLFLLVGTRPSFLFFLSSFFLVLSFPPYCVDWGPWRGHV